MSNHTNAPTREQMTQWALDCGLVEQRDVDSCIIDALFDDLRRFAELAYAAGQTAEREACAKACDTLSNADKNSHYYWDGASWRADLIRKKG